MFRSRYSLICQTYVKLNVIDFTDTEYLYEVDYSGEIVKYNVESGTVMTLVNKTILVSNRSP